ncbi:MULTISPECIES: helix-turn-helix transcriptional regulator [unclassified Streptomyces]|uniref:helix-turn-helix domain-containing protein n=1 Tax=unclassified Streptomyces TaxID=2593676 RepID=UPI0023658527|nr:MULTISPECIES: helix-turn-helix transcriptional regulator [unclassified Streptomyces]MDF3141985.1 helix-turn-helix transcriptional regulator [Streptomyces sp. T21Q-yed]WDF36679.1 helix-turn-helix transcriptional regulator [Streptomyces sp. T12]
MLEQPPVFGAELRRLRMAAGLTLAQFAASVHYSKGQISKIETGQQRATPEFARLCDVALDTGGTLEALAPTRARRRRTGQLPVPDQAGAMRETPPERPGDTPWPPPSRRQLMAAGAMSVFGIGAAPPHPDPSDQPLLDAYRTLFDQYRRIGQLSSPRALLPTLAEQTSALRALAARTGGRSGPRLLNLAARFAEYTGWMAQEAGDEAAAARWTSHAVDLAGSAGDRQLASYSLVRHALITYYRGEAADTVDLAEGALSGALPPRIRALAAQRVGQGHALGGDHDACMRHLDRARDLFDLAAAETSEPDAPVLGTAHLSDPVSLVTGWCLVDLGRPRQAADILDVECARIPAHALRNHARYGARRALAHALSGEIDHACELTGHLLRNTACVGSETVATDLRRLARVLARHPHRPACQAVAAPLTASLTPPEL